MGLKLIIEFCHHTRDPACLIALREPYYKDGFKEKGVGQMKQFMILHVGFEMPTDEIMEKWNSWFAETKSCTIDMGGFMGGREITHDGANDLAWDKACLTGYSVIEASSMEEAEAIASTNPFITAIRIYELRKG